MTTYHVVQGWVDEEGPHNVGDTIDLGDEGLDAMKLGWLTGQGYISDTKPAEVAEAPEPVSPDIKPPPPKKAHRASKATKKS